MALFKKIFGKNQNAAPKGYSEVIIKAIDRETPEAVKVVLDKNTKFAPGQYLTFSIHIDGNEERRSYSICSGKDEPLAVAVKQVENGKVSSWFNQKAEAGTTIYCSEPEGNFCVPNEVKKIVAIAAGSGITPILSIAKACEGTDRSLQLFYGNRTLESTLFKSEIEALKNTSCTYYFSGENVENHASGRIDKTAFSEVIKSNLDLLKSDGFFICGPEEMIVEIVEVLELFGVPKEKIHFELFTTPVLMKSEEPVENTSFEGTSRVTVLIDGEKEHFELSSDGDSILDKANAEDLDVPYSCKGGVCSTCKAKVIKGKATMTMNYSLTDREVEEGYILTCQAHPASEEIIVTYDV